MKKVITFDVAIIKEDHLYAAKYQGDEFDVFQKCFNNWTNLEFLEDFFEENKSDLKNISVEQAIIDTIEEAEIFEKDILECVNDEQRNFTLNYYIFLPLHNKENGIEYVHQHTKAYGSKSVRSYLRLYAIRLDNNCYLVTGGAIKLTKSMQERPHTLAELEKLYQVAEVLRKKNIVDAFDLGFLIIE